ncbi:molybdopterin synthase catalytic subunit-like [Lucilia sericata]|uniref:molybdopterin synthase catalytic subunit-like n=1 Tax=Lucilia sericata TaxID=13632 RepID=UPI0018A848B3|nr:molybdopterin synthase catalytic subunit-like [Lucilia sericata]XP_037806305.1 molybdopterin synthase catalytic subunit-like [Lucilia sericata]XP_037806306.1 molybdopterin synthase catalytic subunit-like [Lucilia sericata]XP_037806307.1 molybdopterin synthase catalytic subunit-like [Lucilia sericata]
MNHLILTRDILNVGEISNTVTAESCGAISLFVGTTRDCFEGKRVCSVEYEAYEAMAIKQIELICEELRRQWPDIVNIAICHRLGLVKVREVSVVIAISSPHRKTSLDAVEVAIDELKKRVPIWKKELYDENESTWKENNEYQFGGSDNLSTFDERMCSVEDSNPLPSQLIQISACENEIKRRIQCFVEKKRDEIDLCNIMDFTDVKQQKQVNSPQELINYENDNNSMTCARVNSTVVKQEYSKCHLKVKKVENNIGPQMRPDYLNALDKLMVPIERKKLELQKQCSSHRSIKEEHMMLKYPTIIERLENIEEHINVPQSNVKNIYQRIKAIEDRILYLESISPEYRHFLVEKSQIGETSNNLESLNETIQPAGLLAYDRKMYSVTDIDTIINSFEKRDLDHQNTNILDK